MNWLPFRGELQAFLCPGSGHQHPTHGFFCRFLVHHTDCRSPQVPPHFTPTVPCHPMEMVPASASSHPAAVERSGSSPAGKENELRAARCDSRCHQVTMVATENTKEVLSHKLTLETWWSSHPCARGGRAAWGSPRGSRSLSAEW